MVGMSKSAALRAFGVCWLLAFAGSSAAQSPEDFFETRIRPVLAANCYACHTDLKSGGLRLDSREVVLKGGNSGPAITPGKPAESLLLRAVRHSDTRIQMPPGRQLKPSEIADIETWIKTGAVWPNSETARPAKSEFKVTAEQRNFWAFRRLHEPPVPKTQQSAWAKTPIDHFVAARLEAAGLSPARPADRRTLLRRAYLDFTGLPPTPAEVDAFLADRSPDAFARVVDRLLASPQYGERSARIWLDVARYADEEDGPGGIAFYRAAWRYRDWVVQAFNDDMPYDRFVRAQIAGDLLRDSKSLVAGTGFLGLGPWYYGAEQTQQRRADERNDRIDAVTRGFLGLTVACARCHNHKYDPISVEDYYALSGVFLSTTYTEYPQSPKEDVERWEAHQKRIQALEKRVADFVENEKLEFAGTQAWTISRYLMAYWRLSREPGSSVETAAHETGLDAELLTRWAEYLRQPRRDHHHLAGWDALMARKAPEAEMRNAAEEFQTLAIRIFDERKEVELKKLILVESLKQPPGPNTIFLPFGVPADDECPHCQYTVPPIARDDFILWRDLFGPPDGTSSFKKDTDGVLRLEEKSLLRFLAPAWQSELAAMRAELERLRNSVPPDYVFFHGVADLPAPRNARINLRGVPTNLGDETPRRFLAVLSPSEPVPFQHGSGRLELAEAIAAHPLTARVIVNRVWQQHFGRGLVRTPDNFGLRGEPPTHPELLEYLTSRFVQSHYSLKALHREILLSATWQLGAESPAANLEKDPENRLLWHWNLRRLDAESIRDSLLEVTGVLDPKVGGPSFEWSHEQMRRTLYGRVSRAQLDRTLMLFDFPDPGITSEERHATNVPLQSLYFLNGGFMRRISAVLADRIGGAAGHTPSDEVAQAYRLIFTRVPSAEEQRLGVEFLRTGRLEQYIQVLLCSNEFLFLS
jgi:mono/diheme cytochrome c family protein